ncbi:MAG: alpha-amylase family glycosyl hydrolase [Sphaerochaetaceae bacterium]
MGSRDLRIASRTRNEIEFFSPLFVFQGSLNNMYDQANSVAHLYNTKQHQMGGNVFVSPGKLNASGVLHLLYQAIISNYLIEQDHDFFSRLSPQVAHNHACQEVLVFYAKEFPSPVLMSENPNIPYFMEETTRGFFVHQVMMENPAILKAIKPFLNPSGIRFPPASQALAALMGGYTRSAPRLGENEEDLFTFLTEPALLYPESLLEQIQFISGKWKDLLPEELQALLLRTIDFMAEEEKPRFQGGPGPSLVPSYMNGTLGDREYEAYSSDRSWMPNVVMIAKSTLVWLDQLSKSYKEAITTLDQIPDQELDTLARRGFTALWLIGLWERSSASKRIKNLCGNPEAEASAYSLKGYNIANSIGGWPALRKLEERCNARHIKLASDMVPNHTGLDSDWVIHRPQLYIQSASAPFPSYTFNGEDLSPDPDIEIKLEDHYYDRTDAAVAFRRTDRKNQTTTYIFHGNDGTSMPWNDTAQLDFLNPETREAVIEEIIHVAKNFHIIRFDAAMTLARKHIQRLWYPRPGTGGDIPGRSSAGLSDEEFNRCLPQEFWREVVDRVAREVPDTLLLAEAFWMMEGYFVRTLGMHRVYNSAFMNMLKDQENKKYRDTIKNTMAFDPEVLKRFVNFMNNPDEESAVAQFGNGDRYFGICTLLATMPGLPMFGHGQVEGYREKYGMEYRKAYWDESPDEGLVQAHGKRIFPLLKLRALFSGVDNFELFDVVDGETIAESVFAYVNGDFDTKALVLYNNQLEHAQGRIHLSVPKLSRLANGMRETKTTSVAESLGLGMGGRRYTIYDNFSNGLTYILPSMAVYDEGLWVSLEGYETQVILNIREVEDFDGTYEQLCDQLDGKGTASFQEELRAIRLVPVFKAMENFRSPEMLHMVELMVSGNSTPATARKYILLAGEAYARLTTAFEAMDLTTRNSVPQPVHDVEPLGLVREIQRFTDCFSRSTVSPKSQASQEKLFFLAGGTVMTGLPYLMDAFLALKPFLENAASLDEASVLVDSLLLTRFFASALQPLGIDRLELQHILKGVALLAVPPQFLLDLPVRNAMEPADMLRQLFSMASFREYTGCNEYKGIVWYKKESFQEAVFLMCLGSYLKLSDDYLEPLFRLGAAWLESDSVADCKLNGLLKQS